MASMPPSPPTSPITMPITTGAAIPTAGLRDHTESRIARQVNPDRWSMPPSWQPRSRKASEAGMVWPESPLSGWCPR